VIGLQDPGGLLVPGGDAEALAAAIGRALDDGALRRRLGANGRRRAEGSFSWRRAAELTVDQYRRAMAGC
jgi:glycosyltransferase involved in cell wall biosynthesis